MDNFSILGTITLFLVFASLLLALFTFTVKTSNKLANRCLGLYFLIFSIHISVFFYSKYIELPLVFEMLRDHIAFLTSPLLYLYIVASIYADFKLRPKHLLHALPFLIEILIFAPRFYLANSSSRVEFIENFNSLLESKVSILFGLLVTLLYLILSFNELKKYKYLLMQNYSYKKVFNYKWLYQLVVLLSVIYCISVIKQIYKLSGTDIEVLNLLRIILTLALLLFLTWVVLKSMYQPELFRNIDSKLSLSKSVNNKIALNNSKVSKTVKGDLDRLKTFMSVREPYLNASLTLNKLAELIKVSPRELSITINHNLNKHFFDFINEYRINKAKTLIDNIPNNKLTIQQIMYEVGFNSKSSFYTEFKKQTLLTPSQYKDRVVAS